MMKKIALLLIVLTAVFSQSEIRAAVTAEQVAQKAAAVVQNAKGLSASFTLSGNGRKSSGSIVSSGNKFAVLLPDVSSWYNGKDLYTHNARTQETTVITPTAQELLESNPLLYVKGGGGAYTYRFSTVKRNGKYVVELTPVKGGSGIKKLTFTVNSRNFHTERIVASTTGGTLTIDVTDFKATSPLPASAFEYPRGKYPKAEIIDLR